MTLQEFEKKYVYEKFTDKNNFKNDKKVIRNLSKVSYRLLNHILYIYLFFAKLITNKNEFDKYLQNNFFFQKILNLIKYIL